MSPEAEAFKPPGFYFFRAIGPQPSFRPSLSITFSFFYPRYRQNRLSLFRSFALVSDAKTRWSLLSRAFISLARPRTLSDFFLAWFLSWSSWGWKKERGVTFLFPRLDITATFFPHPRFPASPLSVFVWSTCCCYATPWGLLALHRRATLVFFALGWTHTKYQA